MRKKAKFSILTGIIVALIAGFLIFIIVSKALGKQSDNVLNPLKKLLPGKAEASDPEADRVKMELEQNAENLFNSFGILMEECLKSIPKDNYCECGTFDFTPLSDYYLKITKSNGKQILELLDKNKVSFKQKEIGEFWIGPILSGPGLANSGDRIFYGSPSDATDSNVAQGKNMLADYGFVIFSKDSMLFNVIGPNSPNQLEKSKGKMNKLNFIKRKKGTSMFFIDAILPEKVKFILPTDYLVIDENVYDGFLGFFGFAKCQ